MAKIEAKHIWKIYPGDVIAVKDVNFCCEDGEFLAILGPSGCGKSSTLRMIAGLEEISRGELLFNDTVVNNMTPQERNIALAFESYALYPPLTVYENLAFPLRAKKIESSVVDKKVKQVAELMNLTDMLKRKPGNLSGGQQQRVSLARALIRDPNLFLLDEPISHMDKRVRSVLRARIARIQDELKATTIYVTHDQEEAVALADRIIVMNHSLIQQIGTVDELWNDPVNMFVAGFLGEPSMNFLDGKIETPIQVSICGRDGKSSWNLKGNVSEQHVGTEVIVGVRPQKILASVEQDNGSVPFVIEVVEPLGEIKVLTGKMLDSEIRVVVSREAKLPAEAGKTIWLTLRPKDIHVFHKADGNSLIRKGNGEPNRGSHC